MPKSRFARALAGVLLPSFLAAASGAAAAKPAATGTVCGTIGIDTSSNGPLPQHVADVVRFVVMTPSGRPAGRVRYGAETTRATRRLLPYTIAGLPLGQPLRVIAGLRGPLASPVPSAGFQWSMQLEPAASAPRGPIVIRPGSCVRVDYTLELLEAPPMPPGSASPAPAASSPAPAASPTAR